MSDASMTPGMIAPSDLEFRRFVRALYDDPGLVIELATVAAKAAAARDELIARGVVPVRVDSMPASKPTTSTDPEERARLEDEVRKAANRRQRERRQAAEDAMTAEQLEAMREARRAADRARIAALSPEKRQARLAAQRERKRAQYAAMTPEERAARASRQAEDYQRRKAQGS